MAESIRRRRRGADAGGIRAAQKHGQAEYHSVLRTQARARARRRRARNGRIGQGRYIQNPYRKDIARRHDKRRGGASRAARQRHDQDRRRFVRKYDAFDDKQARARRVLRRGRRRQRRLCEKTRARRFPRRGESG